MIYITGTLIILFIIQFIYNLDLDFTKDGDLLLWYNSKLKPIERKFIRIL